MDVERRDSVKQPELMAQLCEAREEAMITAKPFIISKHRVYEAYRLVKANAGSAGVDKQSIAAFEEDLKGNLYKLWNRMSSGSYMPPPVRAVPIPKKSGGERILGVPTVSDRIAQDALKAMRVKIRKSRLRSRTDLSLNDIAQWLNPIMRGWIAYYGKFYRSAMYAIIRHVNKTLVRWFMRKYKAIKRSKMRAMALFARCMKETPGLFVQWREGMKGAFA
ncbi:MAG: group II intron maturase-specific domain-containing protein [Candidatus Sedimenticola sp. (ex Thyasira tokunagai)]